MGKVAEYENDEVANQTGAEHSRQRLELQKISEKAISNPFLEEYLKASADETIAGQDFAHSGLDPWNLLPREWQDYLVRHQELLDDKAIKGGVGKGTEHDQAPWSLVPSSFQDYLRRHRAAEARERARKAGTGRIDNTPAPQRTLDPWLIVHPDYIPAFLHSQAVHNEKRKAIASDRQISDDPWSHLDPSMSSHLERLQQYMSARKDYFEALPAADQPLKVAAKIKEVSTSKQARIRFSEALGKPQVVLSSHDPWQGLHHSVQETMSKAQGILNSYIKQDFIAQLRQAGGQMVKVDKELLTIDDDQLDDGDLVIDEVGVDVLGNASYTGLGKILTHLLLLVGIVGASSFLGLHLGASFRDVLLSGNFLLLVVCSPIILSLVESIWSRRHDPLETLILGLIISTCYVLTSFVPALDPKGAFLLFSVATVLLLGFDNKNVIVGLRNASTYLGLWLFFSLMSDALALANYTAN